MEDSKTADQLLEEAKAVYQNSHAPYSGYRVGAALLTGSGKIMTGCNVENVTYGATRCAEQVAITKAVSEGEREFKTILIYAEGDLAPVPCGICRQIMWEFSEDLEILVVHGNQKKKYTLKSLMPMPFSKTH